MSVDLLCMGEPMLEYSQLPTDSEGRRLYLEGFGGDTSNTAIAAARQGASVGYVTAVGEDRGGDEFLQLWRNEGVDTSTVIRRPDLPTAIYFVLRKGDGHEFLFHRAGSAAASYGPPDLPQAAVAGARIFYASGISQAISDSAAQAVSFAIDIARQANLAVAYDTNYRARLWPPARADDYSLIVDGHATVEGETVHITPERAVRHRPAPGGGSDCAPVTPESDSSGKSPS